ncbi:MAG: hypothetical protein P8J86_02070 [Phycisphaerales bacterium]|nr:hypothetical protein [Phycisphaerales bacterium]
MRCIGEFVGHVGRAIKTTPSENSERREISRTTEEREQGDVTLRRTTVEEVEFKATRTNQDS